ncbi:nucleotide pyrophosphatase/phosphodiesterase family protein [Thermopolyspora sp. NPDC052614]|uniref:alkaline phosphatase family protein n=1 Tax=Thermopolyspora sp. NPDC052614 TaxID=3155682 RepID=UPI003413165F
MTSPSGDGAAPLIPAYGEASLADLPGSALAALGLGGTNTLNLAPARRVCVFLVDGLGERLLRAHAEVAPFLSAHLDRVITAGFPATTVTSLGTLGTGVPPGEHGMLGLRLAVPGEGRMLNCLRWTIVGPQIEPETWQPVPTVYQRAEAAGVRPVYVGPAMFEGTGLTRAVHRGVRYVAADSVDDRVAGVQEALRADRAYVITYYGDLDATGHFVGAGTPEWREQLAIVDAMAERIAAALPPGSALYVTADHGMVNVTDRIDVDAIPELREGVAMVGGDARARHVYAEPGAAEAVLQIWRETLAGRGWVVSREEAVAAGWFGRAVRREWLERVGDVVAVPYGDCAVIASQQEPKEAAMVGMHGSLTAEEQYIPLVEVSTR